jgi:hypothetical protein
MRQIKAALLLAGAVLALNQTPQSASAQGKGKGQSGENKGGGKAEGKGQGKAQGKGQGKGQGRADGDGPTEKIRGNSQGNGKGGKSVNSPGRAEKSKSSHGNFKRAASISSMPQSVRGYAASRHAREVIAAAAVSHAFARGKGNDVRIEQAGDRIRLLNRRGDPLLFIDDRDAENLGRWRVDVVDDDVREGAPSFCRSGAGHPVWGREWCLDKGFGLGSYDGDFRWGRTNDVGNIIYSRGTLADGIVGTALQNLLGNTAFNRLALHAITLGLVEPLVGRFVGEPSGPQYVVVNSGTYPVAELYDTNRDSRWDNLLVALRSW